MGKLFKELVTKYGYGLFMSAISLDAYRITVRNDQYREQIERIQADNEAAKIAKNIQDREEYLKNMVEADERVKNCAVMGRYKEACSEHYSAVQNYNKEPKEQSKNAVDRAKQKLDKSYEEVLDLKQSSIYESFNSLYNNYIEILDNISPDKIVCIFNIIVGGLTLSSFFSIFPILLSEKIIKKIKFLDRFPKILEILKIRNIINKKIATVYLIFHLVLILGGILGNVYMFFV